MAWLAVDVDGNEWIYDLRPERHKHYDILYCYWVTKGNQFVLPKGAIQRLIGRKLSWDDEPVEFT